jgi:uncharacterized protein (UPF0332 family)
VKPETADFLAKARELLAKARNQLEILHYNDEAGRAAYLAGLHAAHALIFERTGKISKQHRGVQRLLQQVTRDEPRFNMELRAFLGRTYNLKAIADYLTGPGSEVSVEQAEQAIATAERFIACVVELLAEPPAA